MKKLLLIFTLLFSVLTFAQTSGTTDITISTTDVPVNFCETQATYEIVSNGVVVFVTSVSINVSPDLTATLELPANSSCYYSIRTTLNGFDCTTGAICPTEIRTDNGLVDGCTEGCMGCDGALLDAINDLADEVDDDVDYVVTERIVCSFGVSYNISTVYEDGVLTSETYDDNGRGADVPVDENWSFITDDKTEVITGIKSEQIEIVTN